MAKRDYYETLGVGKQATADELKKAYRKLAMQYHPDRNPGDSAAEAQFKEVSEAYEILKDDQKRSAYDRFGHDAFTQGMGGGGGGNPFGQGGFADIFEEMFGDIMGGGNRRGRGNSSQRGNDLRYNMAITLEEAFHGKKAEIRIPTTQRCGSCAGTGAAEGGKTISCTTCNGHGKVRQQQGFFTIERVCPSCHGQGSMIDKPCGTCHGQGREQSEKTLAVDIPAGVDDGTRIRLANEGEAGLRGAPAGDLYIFLEVQPHPLFKRHDTDLFCMMPIPMVDAALGGTIDVPTIDGGRAKVKIPEGTQTGQQFRLRSKGMQRLRSTFRGDMFIEVAVETPVNLTREQRELLEKFQQTGKDKQGSYPQSDGFFAKVKEFWDDLTE